MGLALLKAKQNASQLADITKVHIAWMSDPHIETNFDRIDRINWVARELNNTKPNTLLVTGDLVEGNTTTSTGTLDRAQFIEGWSRFQCDRHMLLGNRDNEVFTDAEWVSALGWEDRQAIVGNKTDEVFTVSNGGINVRVIMSSWNSTAHMSAGDFDYNDSYLVKYWRDVILDADAKGDSAVFLCTHGGELVCRGIDGAVLLARTLGATIKVYHLFNHHHPLAEVMTEATTLSGLDVSYTATDLVGYIIPALQDYGWARYANIYVDKQGDITYDTVTTSDYNKFYGAPEAGQTPYYWLGNENVAWVDGNVAGTGYVAKEAENLVVNSGSTETSINRRAYVTDVEIDLTTINTLYVDWGTNYTQPSNVAYLLVGGTKTGDHNSYDLRLSKSDFKGLGRGVYSLDVSSLTGSYYIKIMARTVLNYLTTIKVFRVWGE